MLILKGKKHYRSMITGAETLLVVKGQHVVKKSVLGEKGVSIINLWVHSRYRTKNVDPKPLPWI